MEKNKKKNLLSGKEKQNQLNQYLKYSGLAFQLFGTIAVFLWLGWKLDRSVNEGRPLFILIFLFLAVGGGLYQLYRSLPKD